MGILRDCWRKEGSLQVVRAMQSHLSSHHPDKYAGESSKESQSQRKLDSFVHAKKCPAEHAEEITRRIAEMVARDLRPISIVEGAGFPIIRYSIVKEATIRIAKITIRFSTTYIMHY